MNRAADFRCTARAGGSGGETSRHDSASKSGLELPMTAGTAFRNQGSSTFRFLKKENSKQPPATSRQQKPPGWPCEGRDCRERTHVDQPHAGPANGAETGRSLADREAADGLPRES